MRRRLLIVPVYCCLLLLVTPAIAQADTIVPASVDFGAQTLLSSQWVTVTKTSADEQGS